MSGDHNQNQTTSSWRKRQIALNKKAENARELGLDYEPSIIEMAREALEVYWGKAEHRRTKNDERKAVEAITAIKEALAQPEFTTHEVENPEDWSEWVCPDPKGYLLKCCDCGLVHEMQTRVAQYVPVPSEEFEVVKDADVQAQLRMRRSGAWTPEDRAYRPNGLAQQEQKPTRQYDTSLENQLRQSGIWFDRGRHSAFKEIAEKIKEMPWESDTKDSFLVWLKEQT